ncbi:hypothetical protein CLF_113301, partial [Clonorchis sinensis]
PRPDSFFLNITKARIAFFSCSTLLKPNCHATRRKHESWDTARLLKSRQGEIETQRLFTPEGKEANTWASSHTFLSSAVQEILERAVSIQKAYPTIRCLSEDRPLQARKLGHSSSREKPLVPLKARRRNRPPLRIPVATQPPQTPRLRKTAMLWRRQASRGRSAQMISLIVGTVVIQDPDSQSHKPDHSEPENPSYPHLATTRVSTQTRKKSDCGQTSHLRFAKSELLADFKMQSSEKTSLMGAPPKELLLDAATRCSGPHRDAFPIKPRQNAQETRCKFAPNP